MEICYGDFCSKYGTWNNGTDEFCFEASVLFVLYQNATTEQQYNAGVHK